MNLHDTTSETGASRRKIIQSGIIASLSVVGLSAKASAHEEDEENEGDEQGDEKANETNALEANISISDHQTGGGAVTVDSVYMSDGGFVSIHDRRRFDGKILPSIIGITNFLEPGDHGNVSVPLFTDHATAPGPAEGQNQHGLTESQPLIAIPHLNKTGSAVFERGDPAYENGPKTLGAFPVVNDIATVFVKGDSEKTRNAAKEEEANARANFS